MGATDPERPAAATPTLTARVRTVRGKKVKRLRDAGLVPAVVYGRGLPSTPLQLDGHELREALAQHALASLLHLRVEGEPGGPRPVLVQRMARHPLTGVLLHVDFHQVEPDRPIRSSVPVMLVGEAPATRAGGVLIHGLDTVEIECRPRDLPAHLELDATRLAEIDDALYVRDLELPPGVTMDTSPDELLAKVVASKAELELEAEKAAAAAAAEEEREKATPSADEKVRGGPATPGAPPSPPPAQRTT